MCASLCVAHQGYSGLVVYAATGYLDGRTWFMMQSAAAAGRCLEAPSSDGGQFILAHCDPSNNRQRLLARNVETIPMSFTSFGGVASYARPDLVLCGTGLTYKWTTSMYCSSPGDSWQFTSDSSQIVHAQSRGCFSIGTMGSPQNVAYTDSVFYGNCAKAVLAGFWIILTPSTASAPPLSQISCGYPGCTLGTPGCTLGVPWVYSWYGVCRSLCM